MLGALLQEIFWELVIYLRCITIDKLIFKDNISRTLITWDTWNRSTTTVLLVVGMGTCMTPRAGRGNGKLCRCEHSPCFLSSWLEDLRLFSRSHSLSLLAPVHIYGCNQKYSLDMSLNYQIPVSREQPEHGGTLGRKPTYYYIANQLRGEGMTGRQVTGSQWWNL